MRGLRKRGQTWWMSFSINGQQIQKSTGTSDRKIAEAIFHKVKAEVAERKWFEVPVGRDMTFSDLMEKYLKEVSPSKAPLTHNREKSLAAHLQAFFGDLMLLAITPQRVSAYKVKRREDGAAPQTINNELALNRHAFNVARQEWEWVADNPVSKVSKEKVENLRDRWLRGEEEERLLAASPRWLQEIITVAPNTGLRRSELLGLRLGACKEDLLRWEPEEQGQGRAAAK